ncbi:alpha/beta hydrolase [Mycobacteroides stephanolepidis]|uniref:Alpha/beta hydrolase n=1 Tax=[Mycobacterium] stephanolepidis TaxID=1520670 RepID=A0A1Z4EYW0_9MYCO|nr:alpha/beta hydrolase [[Mycobacterium] stephanolepidis]
MRSPVERADIGFRSGDARCAGWLYPAGSVEQPAPCVVMGHGFGGVKEGRLDAYAKRFQRSGFAVLVFDYRYFGASTGEPRQLLRVGSQLEDWASTIDYARSFEYVDDSRLTVWGSSFGGGHVIRVAARDPRIVAVIAQVPHTSGPASARAAGAAAGLRTAAAGDRDMLGALLRRPPYYVPVVAPRQFRGADQPRCPPWIPGNISRAVRLAQRDHRAQLADCLLLLTEAGRDAGAGRYRRPSHPSSTRRAGGPKCTSGRVTALPDGPL